MGNYVSKVFSRNYVDGNKTEINETMKQSNLEKECNDSSTHQKLMTDPRSITTEICRTPIRVNQVPFNNTRMAVDVLSKNILRKPYLETNFDSPMTPSTLSKYLDPRSPNVDQPRTPISVDNCTSRKLPITLVKNNAEVLPLKNITNLKYDPRSPSIDFDRTPISIQKATNKYFRTESDENVTLYNETNDHSKFLYCETISSETPEILAVIDEVCEASKSLQFNSIDNIGKAKLCVCDSTNQMNNENIDNDIIYSMKNSPNENLVNMNAIKIWKDSELSGILEQCKINECNDQDEEKFSYSSKEEIEVIFDDDDDGDDGDGDDGDDDDVIKKNKSIPEELNTQNENKDTKDLSENENKVKPNEKTFILHNKNINKILKKRTPFGNRSNNTQLDTVLTNSPQNILQNKNYNNTIQHENTPPHKRSYAEPKYNGMKWDFNSTVII